MRKAIIRTTLTLAIVAGVGVLNSGGAQALPEEVACQNELPVASCVLAGGRGSSEILGVDGDGLVVFLDQASRGDATVTLADAFVALPGDGGVVAQVVDFSDRDNRILNAEAGVGTPGGDNFESLFVQLVNADDAPDSGRIVLSREENDDETAYTGIEWTNRDCTVYQNGEAVGPCVIQVVPKLPYVPFVWLP